MFPVSLLLELRESIVLCESRFSDKYSVEVFINDGEQVMTATFMTTPEATGISLCADGQVEMKLRLRDQLCAGSRSAEPDGRKSAGNADLHRCFLQRSIICSKLVE